MTNSLPTFLTAFPLALDFLLLVSEMQFTCVALLPLFVTAAVATEVWRPTQSVKNPSTVPVTSADQLWRFQVGPGNDGVSIGTRYITLLGSNMKFVRHDPDWLINGRFLADGENCEEAHRFELHKTADGFFALKNTQTQQWLCCENGGEVEGRGELLGWERFNLFLDENDDNLVIRRAIDSSNVLYLWTDGVLHCGTTQSYIVGRNQFVGWKGGDKKWDASDEYVSIREVDNRYGTSPIKVELIYKTGMNLEQQTTRAGSYSLSLGATASLRSVFQVELSSSIGFDWSTLERSSFFERREERISVPVEPGTYFKVLEAVGKYGPIIIFSGHLKFISESVEEVDAEASEMYPTT